MKFAAISPARLFNEHMAQNVPVQGWAICQYKRCTGRRSPPGVQRAAGANAAKARRPATLAAAARGPPCSIAAPPQRRRHRSQLSSQERIERGAVGLPQRRQCARLQASHYLQRVVFILPYCVGSD